MLAIRLHRLLKDLSNLDLLKVRFALILLKSLTRFSFLDEVEILRFVTCLKEFVSTSFKNCHQVLTQTLQLPVGEILEEMHVSHVS